MAAFAKYQIRKLGQAGFTLIELVIIIVTLGILAAVAIPRFSGITESSKVSATKQEMSTIRKAIVGTPGAVAGGKFIDRGFEGDVGFVPTSLVDLAARPGSVMVYSGLTRLGWNGPYLDSTNGNYLRDSWSAAYILDRSNRRLISVGGPDSIIVYF